MHLQERRQQHRAERLAEAFSLLPELAWLLTALLIPLAVNLWGARPFEPPKAALLRALVWTMAAAWLASGLLQRRSLARELASHPLFWPALAVTIVQTLATLFAADRGLSFWGSAERAQGWLSLSAYGMLFLLVAARLCTFEQAQRLATALVIPAAPLAALGIAQALGWAPLPLLTDARSPVYATLGRSNFLGAYLAMLLPLTLAWTRAAPSSSRRVLGAALLVAEIAVIGLTRSRGAALAALAGLALWGWVAGWGWLRRRRWARALLSALGLILLAALLGALALLIWAGSGEGAVIARLALLSPSDPHSLVGPYLTQGSTAARLTIWRAVLPLIARRPLLGYGPDALELVFPSVYPPELVYYQGRGVRVDRAHNGLLDALLTTGAAGVLAQGALLASFFALTWRAAQRADPARRALLAGCLAAVGANLANTLVSLDVTATATATALVMALAVALARLGEVGERPAPALPPMRPLPRAASVPLAVLMLLGLGAALWLGVARPVAADIAALASDRRAAAGDWAGAVAAGERAGALAPYEPAYLRALSWAALQSVLQGGGDPTGGLAQAEAALLAARDLRPGDERTWAALGELYGQAGNRYDPARLPLAHAAYAEAVALAPHDARLYLGWGMVDLEGGRFAEAAARFRRAVELDATDGFAFLRLGDAELAQGRVAEALAAYRQAVEWEPGLSWAYVGMARCLWLQGERAEAEAALAQVLALVPDHAGALALQREMGQLP